MRPVNKLLAVFLTISAMAFLPWTSLAQEKKVETFQPEISIPGLENLPNDSSLMAKYIRAVYIFFVWIVGLLAVVMIIYGGIRWISAAGNAGHIKEARDIVTNAIAGVALALLSVVILRTINPDLAELKNLSLGLVPAVTDIGEYTKFPDFNVCSGEVEHECGMIYDQTFTDGTKSSCYGTFCKPESVGQYGWLTGKKTYTICNIPYNKTDKSYGAPSCVPTITTVYPNKSGSYPVQLPVVELQENDKQAQAWTGVIMSKNGLGSEYTVNRCFDSATAFGFVVGNPAELIPAKSTDGTNTITGHSRVSYRGCPDRNSTKLMSEVLFKP